MSEPESETVSITSADPHDDRWGGPSQVEVSVERRPTGFTATLTSATLPDEADGSVAVMRFASGEESSVVFNYGAQAFESV